MHLKEIKETREIKVILVHKELKEKKEIQVQREMPLHMQTLLKSN